MIPKLLLVLLAPVVAFLTSCATSPPSTTSQDTDSQAAAARTAPELEPPARVESSASGASNLESYKIDLANRIAQANSHHVFSGRPQALLRSVIVVRYSIDAKGHLVRSEILRSNKDKETESVALASLQSASPFPRPGHHLLRRGSVEVSESFLFNSDGRFQLRSIAQAQMSE